MHTQQGSYDQTFYAFYRITYKVYFAWQIGFLAKKIQLQPRRNRNLLIQLLM